MAEKKRRDGSKTERLHIRMSRSESDMLRFASEKLGMSVSDVVRKGIFVEYNLAKIQDENE